MTSCGARLHEREERVVSLPGKSLSWPLVILLVTSECLRDVPVNGAVLFMSLGLGHFKMQRRL